jgi:hypothetical protein
MPAAIGIAMLASAGASMYAAHKQASAAKDAAATQGAATDKAVAVQREANAPYMQLGQQSANRLMQMPQQNYTQAFTGPGGSNGAQAFQMPPQGSLAGLGRPPQGSMPQNGPGLQTQPGPHVPPNGPQGQTLGAMGQQGPQAGQLVQMRAPDGSVKAVPPNVVAQLEARGARRVA